MKNFKKDTSREFRKLLTSFNKDMLEADLMFDETRWGDKIETFFFKEFDKELEGLEMKEDDSIKYGKIISVTQPRKKRNIIRCAGCKSILYEEPFAISRSVVFEHPVICCGKVRLGKAPEKTYNQAVTQLNTKIKKLREGLK